MKRPDVSMSKEELYAQDVINSFVPKGTKYEHWVIELPH